MAKKQVNVSLTRQEALALSENVESIIRKMGERFLFFKRLGWVDAMIESRDVYAAIRDKLYLAIIKCDHPNSHQLKGERREKESNDH